ncbi:hypothetical protein AGLY_014387 [Aphis glycines]|uniref:Reverse transcriptase domain-containing protein n=1 Tax=Aphis glycines TaxID=307491 RepID=A0A6G0T3W2_APHGL|nr:hypothetical protein AGLY_014387 [Aphis glycines]
MSSYATCPRYIMDVLHQYISNYYYNILNARVFLLPNCILLSELRPDEFSKENCSVQHFKKLHSNLNFNSIPYENTKINLKLNIHCPSNRPNARLKKTNINIKLNLKSIPSSISTVTQHFNNEFDLDEKTEIVVMHVYVGAIVYAFWLVFHKLYSKISSSNFRRTSSLTNRLLKDKTLYNNNYDTFRKTNGVPKTKTQNNTVMKNITGTRKKHYIDLNHFSRVSTHQKEKITNLAFTKKKIMFSPPSAGINAGVPQGAVTAPLLFNLFISNQSNSNQTLVGNFADHKAIIASSANPNLASHYVQNHLHLLETWYRL